MVPIGPKNNVANAAGSAGGTSPLRNVFAGWSAYLVSACTGMMLAPIVVHTLGATSYGIWVIIGSLTGPLSLFDLGIRSAVTRVVAAGHARADYVNSSRIVSTAWLMYRVAAFLALVATVVMAVGMPHWFNMPPTQLDDARYVLLLVGGAVAISLMMGLFGGILAGIQRLDVIGFSNIAFELTRVALVLLFLHFQQGIFGLALVTLLVTLGRYGLQRYYARAYCPQLKLQRLRPDRQDVKQVLETSLFSTAIYAAAAIGSQINIYVIGAVLPVDRIAIYAIGSTLIIYASGLSLPIAQTVLSRASHHQALGSVASIKTLVLDAGRIGTLALLPLVFAFVIAGPTFIGIWMGPVYRTESGPILVILSIGAVFSLARHVTQTAFIGAGQHRKLIPIYVLELVATALLSTVFTRTWGLTGAAWAVVVPNLIVCLLAFPLLMRRVYQLSPLRAVLALWLRPICAMLPYAACLWFIDRNLHATTYLEFFEQIALALPVAALGAITIGMSPSERSQVRSIASTQYRWVHDRLFGKLAKR